MDTQNTPIHLRLWHRDFWLLCMSSMLLSASAYSLLSILPWLFALRSELVLLSVLSAVAFAAGILLCGPLCSALIQRYPRARVFRLAVLAFAGGMLALWLLQKELLTTWWNAKSWPVLAVLLMMGGAFWAARMTLSSTLVIDTCESFRRTEANYVIGWFSRFGLPIGCAMVLGCLRMGHLTWAPLCAAAMAVGAWLCVALVKFPFKAPDDSYRWLSLDRFFMPSSWPLGLAVMLFAFIEGFYLPVTSYLTVEIGYFMVGFLAALVAEKLALANAHLKSEVVIGLLFVALSVVVGLMYAPSPAVVVTIYTLRGCGMGLVASRLLLFFIKLAPHCQRGTSLSTYHLMWALGIVASAGLSGWMGGSKVLFAIFRADAHQLAINMQYVHIALIAIYLVLYLAVFHPWYVCHKNR